MGQGTERIEDPEALAAVRGQASGLIRRAIEWATVLTLLSLAVP